MRINDVVDLIGEVETISAQAPADEAQTLMKQNNIHHLVVLEGHNIVGVISDRDVRGDLTGVRVSDRMSDDVAFINPDSTFRDAANLMRGRNIGCLPVYDEKKDTLVGIITISDILDLIGQGMERVTADPDRRPIRNTPPGQRLGIH